MRATFGLGSLTVVTGFCLVQACSSEDATPQADADAGGNGSTSSSTSTSSSSGSTSSTSSSGATSTSSSGGTDAGGDATTDGGKKSTMTFFVTSTGNGADGGDFGGLKGADEKCATLAKAVGGGDHTWAAYLSAEGVNGGQAVNAKDRIGAGPWTNQKGVVVAKDLTALHTTGIKSADIVDETGKTVPANEHDIFTGSKADGTLFAATNASCKGYTTKIGDGAYVGHSDWETTSGKWNSAHAVKNCDAATIASVKGAARIYCFAKD